MPDAPQEKKVIVLETPLDEIYAEIGYVRLKGEDDEAFKRRAAFYANQEEWGLLAEKARTRLKEILNGADSDASEMAAIRTALERADGEPKKRLELSGIDGAPLAIATVPVTQDQLDRFLKRHAKVPLTDDAGS